MDDAPPNAAVELGEFPHLAARIQSHVGFDISREELAGYDFWGHSDLDDRHQTARMTVWPSCSAT